MAASAYLIAGSEALSGMTAADFAAALRGAGIASVLIEGTTHLAVQPEHLAALIEAGQQAGTAVLVDDIAIARAFRADGVHLAFVDDADRAAEGYRAARAVLPSGIVGGSAGCSRHHAMVLGELGADYVAFGDADADMLIDCVAWWAELFEPPVVAWDIGSAELCHQIMQANADFVAIRAQHGDTVLQRARDLRRWLGGGD